MENDRWRDVGVGDLVVLNEATEELEIESGHDESCEASVGWEMDETLKTCYNHVSCQFRTSTYEIQLQ